MNIRFNRIMCLYCLTIDAIDLSLLVATLTSPLYFLPAMFALGFSYDGIAREGLFQMEHYNYYPYQTLKLAKVMYYVLAVVISIITGLFSVDGAVVFIVALLLMNVINGGRYKEALEKGQADMKYDMYMFIPLFFGILILYLG